MDNEKSIFAELINLENELYNHTKYLVNQVSVEDLTEIPIIEFRLSELLILKSNLDLFLKINSDYQHYEFTSLISFWEDSFHELKEVIEDDDSNTSWMIERFDNYSKQHDIVDKMIRSAFGSE